MTFNRLNNFLAAGFGKKTMNIFVREGQGRMNFRNVLLSVVGMVAFVAMVPSSASAGTLLQLDILGGSYDTANEDVYIDSITANPFTLRAYYEIGKPGPAITEQFFLSVALTPKVAEFPAPSLGSITIDGAVVDVVGDMTFGTPPIETYTANAQDKDLGSHDIFDTYFYELGFNFDVNQQRDVVNVQTSPGTTDAVGGSGMAYVDFSITSDLQPGVGLHFDLYHFVLDGDNKQIDAFAPFSHDAQYRVLPPVDPPPGPSTVPEPTSMAIFAAIGLLGLRRRQRS